jgi:molybdopterin synthase sulfur carrier subunit
MREDLLDEAGELLGHIHVFINGRDAPYLDDGLETTLAAGDTVDVFPAVAGG